LAEGSFNEACKRFEASQSLDPGPGTELNLADCYERKGMLATAWATFRSAGVDARRGGRPEWAVVADSRADALEGKVPKVVLHVADGATAAPRDVQLDGQAIGAESLGLQIPLDPGAHRIAISAPGFVPFDQAFTLELGDVKTIDLPALTPVPVPDRVPGPVPSAQPDAAAGPSSPKQPTDIRLPLGIGMASLGVIGIGLGTYFGILSLSKNSQATHSCPDASNCPDASGPELANEAKTARTESIASFSTGGAFAIAGGILIGVALASKAHRVPIPTAALTQDGWRVGAVVNF
jgi:hypothetical protein